MQFPAFKEWQEKSNRRQTTGKRAKDTDTVSDDSSTLTPDESKASAYQVLRSTLAVEILEKVKCMQPAAFEQLVVDLMVRWVTEVRRKIPAGELSERQMKGSMGK